MSIDQKILAFLQAEHPHRFSAADLNKQLKISSGSLYPALQRLEMAGEIKGEWIWRRKVYSVNPIQEKA